MNTRIKYAAALITLYLSTASGANPTENIPVPLSLQQRVTTSAQGLTESAALSGHFVDLQGRFQSLIVANINASGDLKVQCLGTEPSHKHLSDEGVENEH